MVTKLPVRLSSLTKLQVPDSGLQVRGEIEEREEERER